MFPLALSKSVNFFVCKKSFVSYKLIALDLQVNFKKIMIF